MNMNALVRIQLLRILASLFIAIKNMADTNPPETPQSNPQVSPAAQNETLMGVLAYLGILIVIPFIMAKDDPFVKFHLKQGLVLVLIEVVVWFLGGMFFWHFWPLLQLVNLATLILSIIGIVNVVNKKQAELPLVGTLAHHFNF
jgi:uncharacterized membrane protein